MYFLSIIILCCLIRPILNMPTQVLVDYDKEAKEDSYGDSYRSDSGDYLQNQPKPSLKHENGKVDDRNDELERAIPERDYLENNDEDQAESAHSSHNRMRPTNNKRTAEYNKESVMLFENHEKPRIIKKSEYSGQQFMDSNQPALNNADRNADFKRFINKGDSVSRDRREINNSDTNGLINPGDTGSTQKLDFDTNEDEETAIKRHIKKLSKLELDELMNSLSDDKRALLKNIIDNSQQEIENVNKREITKKAGTNEDNSLVGNEPSDTSKIQGGSADIEAEPSASNTEKSENLKKLESETSCSKSTETITSSENPDTANVLDSIEDAKLKKSDVKDETETKIQDSSNEQETTKNEKKREVNLNTSDVSNGDAEVPTVNNDELFCSQNDGMSEIWNEESKLYRSNNIDKREVWEDNSDSFKSLEDSFPNSDDLILSRRGSNMLPLVRVKRKDINKLMQRRDTNDISDLKVPFFSNAVEENEYDSDEGSEFEGDGIFSKRSNFKSEETNHDTDNRDADSPMKEKNNNYKIGNHNGLEKCNNLESNMVSLGSDTDAILSGIEGIDDNLMYNSASRNRRNLNKFNNLNDENNIEYYKPKNIPEVSENEYNEISERNNNAPRYQENDAFGSLPRNYEEDLGRFKRIRRLKPLSNVENSLPLKQ